LTAASPAYGSQTIPKAKIGMVRSSHVNHFKSEAQSYLWNS